MRAVVDSNVLVSGLLSEKGPPGQIVVLLFQGDLQPVVNANILAEYREVLSRAKFDFKSSEREQLLGVIEEFGFPVEPIPWPVQLPDSDDEPFIAAAAAAEAPLITVNLRHFPKRVRRNVEVMSPRDFIEHWRDSA